MTRRWADLGSRLSVLAVGLTLGLLLSVGWQRPLGAGAVPPDTTAGAGRIWEAIDRLEAEQQALRATLSALRQEAAGRQSEIAADTDRLRALQSEVDRQRLLAGLIAVQGPGVEILLDDSAAEIPARADPSTYIVHEFDLRDIVNLLWMAGSEAIAINGERMVSSSAISCVGTTILINSTRLSPPYLIRAIGNPRVQSDYLRNPSYLRELRARVRTVGLQFEVRAMIGLTVPAYGGSFAVQHAQPGE